jgi:hypothetical protein
VDRVARVDDGWIVGGDDEGASLPGTLTEQLDHEVPVGGVEGGRRFVHQHETCVLLDSAGDRQSLSFTTAEVGGLLVTTAGQPGDLQRCAQRPGSPVAWRLHTRVLMVTFVWTVLVRARAAALTALSAVAQK